MTDLCVPYRVFDRNGNKGTQTIDAQALGGNMTVKIQEDVENMTKIMSMLTGRR